MRKLKERLTKDPVTKKVLKARKLSNQELKEKLPIARLLMATSFFKTHFNKTFRYNGKSLVDSLLEGLKKEKISQGVFDVDTYGYEIVQLLGLYNIIYCVTDLDVEKGKFIVACTKNPLLKEIVNNDVIAVMDKYRLIIVPFLQDITHKDLKRHIDNMICLVAVAEVLYMYFNDISKEMLSEFHTIEQAKKIRSYLTKFKNRIPKILSDITGLDSITATRMKEGLESIGVMKYDVKDG